ncbi:MAG: hypothetical protein ACRYGK_01735 [Janthinobacterium lividum]
MERLPLCLLRGILPSPFFDSAVSAMVLKKFTFGKDFINPKFTIYLRYILQSVIISRNPAKMIAHWICPISPQNPAVIHSSGFCSAA